jgi:hypothetical protein
LKLENKHKSSRHWCQPSDTNRYEYKDTTNTK